MALQYIDQADILSSWILQTAIIGAFALSTFGITFALRRPAMRQLSVIWALYFLAAITGLVASWTMTQPVHGLATLVLLS